MHTYSASIVQLLPHQQPSVPHISRINGVPYINHTCPFILAYHVMLCVRDLHNMDHHHSHIKKVYLSMYHDYYRPTNLLLRVQYTQKVINKGQVL